MKPTSFPAASLMIVARIVVVTIPIRRSPRTPRARSTIVRTRPKKVTKIGHVVSRPRSTIVPSPGTTIPALVQADEGDEEADPDRDRLLQVERDRVHDPLAHPAQDEDRDRDALDDDEPHRGRERQPFAGDEAERDHGVEAEAGRDRIGVVRVEAHQDRHHARDEARDGEHLVEGQSELAQLLDPGEAEDLGVDEDDVGHDDERRHAARPCRGPASSRSPRSGSAARGSLSRAAQRCQPLPSP